MPEVDDKTLVAKMKKMHPNADALALTLVHTIGASANIVEYFSTRPDILDADPMVLYACALICNNMMLLTSDFEDIIEIKQVDDVVDLKLSEQGQETIFRKLKFVVEQLNKYIESHEI